MRKSSASVMALGGILAALAVVVMCMGTLIPAATFVCPLICMMILRFVVLSCGGRLAWSWYGAVTILSLLMAPDKEAAAVFAVLGYYPIVKPKLDRLPCSVVWKLLLFNVSIVLMYWILMHLMGMSELGQDFREFGMAMTVVLLLLGNVTFLLMDFVLSKRIGRIKHGK